MSEKATCLQLTDNYRVVRADDRNFELEEYREVVARPNRYVTKKTVSKKWVSLGFYSDISQAVTGVLKSEEGNLTANQRLDLEAMVVELKKISENLKESVRNSGIKLEHFVKVKDGRGKKAKEVTVAKVKEKASEKATKRGRPKKVATKS